MKMTRRILAFVLCLCMLVPIFGGVVDALGERASTPYDGNIGRKAKFNPTFLSYGGFQVSDAPETEVEWSSATNVPGSEVSADTIVIIEDAYLNEEQGTIWYLIRPAEGYRLPDLMVAEPWIFHNTLVDGPDYDSLIFLEEEPEVTEPEPTEPEVTEPEPTEPEVTEPTEPEVTAPDPCPVCGIYSCGKIHLYCHVCDAYDCELTHTYCAICGAYDCGLEHEDIFTPITSPVIPQNPDIPEDVEFALVDGEGNLVEEELVLQTGRKTSISAWSDLEGELSYRWQVCYDLINDRWVDIQGETGKGLLTSPAMFTGILADQGAAMLRCVITSGEQEQICGPISVRVASQGGVFNLPRGTGAEQVADDGTDLEMAYLIVQYVYEGGRIAAATDVVQLTPGVAVDYDAYELPVIRGYEARLEVNPYPEYVRMDMVNSKQVLNVHIPTGHIKGNVEFKVTYYATEVNYTVIHYQQNVTGSEYTKVAEETGTQYTGQIIENVHKNYTGFYNLIYETPAAAADGSTVIEVYYDREYYLMKFDLGGGYGVDPVYERYGATVNIGMPVRPGYTFLGWDTNGDGVADITYGTNQTITRTIQNRNESFTAVWKMVENPVKATVVIWGENADDEGYSYQKTISVDAYPGETISWDKVKYTCGYVAHTHNANCITCGNAEHTHTRSCYTVNRGGTLSQTVTNSLNNAISMGNDVYRTGNWNNYKYYLKIGNAYYQITNYNSNNFSYSITCGAHTHTASCYGCGSTEHTHSNSCESDILDSKLWYLAESETATVSPDGTTILNVYFDRVEFTMHFRKKNSNKDDYGTITDKWGADIGQRFLAINNTANGNLWSTKSNANSPWTGYLQIMPQADVTYYLYATSTNVQTAEYYVEMLDGTYELEYAVATYYQSNLTISAEDFYEMQGFTYSHGTDGDGKQMTSPGSYGNYDGAKFYYTRHKYAIEFYNPVTKVTTKTGVPYQANLASYDFDLTPDQAPNIYEPGSVEFAGWYLDPDCAGAEYILADHTMPSATADGATALVLYAKWEPKTFDLDMYLDSTLGDIFHDLGEVHYGQILGPLTNPEKTGYDFVGWFYKDENGVEHAFDPENMPIKGGWKIYAKWTSSELYPYTIKFQLLVQKGNDWVKPVEGVDEITQVAPPITGSGIAGYSYTFEAKYGQALDTAYQTGYFPDVTSHSLNVEIPTEGNDPNTFTFWYKPQDKVSYTVRGLDKADNTVLFEQTFDSTNVAVTENFRYIDKYVPDAFQKTLLLSTTGENVITFWYTKDEQNALYVVNHWVEYKVLVEYEDGRREWKHGGYTLKEFEQGMDKIGATITAEQKSFEGYDLDTAKTSLVDGKLSGQIVAQGLQLDFYYTPIMYDYQYNFWLLGTVNDLAEPVAGEAPYGATVSLAAPEIQADLDGDGIVEDYRLYNPSEDVKYITIGSLTNQAVFYYTRATQNMTITTEIVNHASFPDEDLPKSFDYQLRIHAKDFHRDSYNSSLGVLKPDMVNGVPVLKFTLKWDKDKEAYETITIEGLPTAEYTLTELNVPLGYYDEYSPEHQVNGRYRLTVDEQVDIVVTNKYEPAVLRISKEVVSTAPEETDFQFTITFRNNVTPEDSYTYTVFGPEENAKVTRTVVPDGKNLIITLRHGETAQFVNLPLGTYTVDEADYSQDYTTSWRVDESGDFKDGRQAQTTLERNKVTLIEFCNTPLGADLTIRRTNGASDGQVFVYTVRKIEGDVIAMSITVTVTGNGSTTIHDLPLGDYVVTQENGWSWRYGDNQQSITHNDSEGTTVTFGGSWLDKWLNGNSGIKRNVRGG